MTNPVPAQDKEPQAAGDPCDQALAEAVSGLEIIRDEGPEAEPTYPANGQIEAHEAWAFDSASHERAKTAREALASVEAITAGASAQPG